MLGILYYDLLVLIFDLMDLESQLKFMSTCKYAYNNFFITKIIKDKIRPETLLQKKYMKLKMLNLKYSNNIFQNDIIHLNLTHLILQNRQHSWLILDKLHLMTNLKQLCLPNCYVDQQNIDSLNLIKLNIQGASRVTNVSHMTHLENLNISNNCGVNQSGIKNLNLYILYADDNPHITSVSWMNNLTILNASNNCGIDQYGISHLNLKCLYASNNTKINCVNFMTKLEILDASCTYNCLSYTTTLSKKYYSNIDQQGIEGLNLKKLNINGNKKITNVSFMTNLETLFCGYSSGISQHGDNLNNLVNISFLDVSNNIKIHNVSIFKNLKILVAINNEFLSVNNLPDLNILHCLRAKCMTNLTLTPLVDQQTPYTSNVVLYNKNNIQQINWITYYMSTKF